MPTSLSLLLATCPAVGTSSVPPSWSLDSPPPHPSMARVALGGALLVYVFAALLWAWDALPQLELVPGISGSAAGSRVPPSPGESRSRHSVCMHGHVPAGSRTRLVSWARHRLQQVEPAVLLRAAVVVAPISAGTCGGVGAAALPLSRQLAGLVNSKGDGETNPCSHRPGLR